jgi:hypothetical protein
MTESPVAVFAGVDPMTRARRWTPLGLVLLVVAASCRVASAETIRVDRTPAHATNEFIPNQTLGAGIDRIPVEAIDKGLAEPALDTTLSAGWQPVSYRQNTELAVEAWHWNPEGSWSDPAGHGYFTGSATPAKSIRYSYGYALPHRGFTRNDGTGNAGFSRITDGDPETYWKSNPYLTERFTGESDALHPQWIVVDLAQLQQIDSIRIDWAEPHATRYLVQYWTGDDPLHAPTQSAWKTFTHGVVDDGKGGRETLRLAGAAEPVRFLRILMSASSNGCDSHGSADPRNCVGYAVRELYLGTTTRDGAFHDVARHTPDQEQTTTYCSSVDPWHGPEDLSTDKEAQVGLDLFFESGITRGLPAMVPVSLIYETPENAAAEIAYLEKRGYPISYVEVGEEADGQYMQPEDFAALYVQWAAALHRVDPALKLGGPSFEGVNSDIQAWPDASGRVSWLGRFLDYLKGHGHLGDLAFFSFEHYPYDPCRVPWGSLYEEPGLVSRIMQVWRDDGLPADMPMFITESNLSSGASETYMDIFAAVWLGDYVGSFLTSGGKGLYYFHYLPLQMEHGCNDSPGAFGMFAVDADYKVEQYLSQYFAAQLINLEWVQPGSGKHRVFSAQSDVEDGAGHNLVTAYALERPDGDWSLMLVNRDQENAHKLRVEFVDDASHTTAGFAGSVSISSFGKAQYHWHPATTLFMAHAAHAADHPVLANTRGRADPDGPIVHARQNAARDTSYEIPAASIVVIRGKLGPAERQ